MNRSHKPLRAEGIVVHETANPGGTAEMDYKYFNSDKRNASAHAFVDWNEIIQTIPWNEQAGHAGSYANKRYLGIELCRPKSYDKDKFMKVWKKGVWLFAYLYVNELGLLKVNKDNLLSHDEIRIRFGGTTHTDPIAYFKEYGFTVDDFRQEVQKVINSMVQGKKDKAGDWRDIIYKATSSPKQWERAINIIGDLGKSEVKLGDLEILKYLPELIEKLYTNEKLIT